MKRTQARPAFSVQAGLAMALAAGLFIPLTACSALDERRASPEDAASVEERKPIPDTRIERLWLKPVKQNGRPLTDADADRETPSFTLSTRAGTLELQAVAHYADGAEKVLASGVAWQSSDSQTARVSAGVVTAHSDGEAVITASVPQSAAASGPEVRAEAHVIITGQTTNPYVASLEIASEGDPSTPITAFLNEGTDVYESYASFCAIVHTVDPITGEETAYSTANGPLFDQTAGKIADLSWNVVDNDTSAAAVQDSNGTALFVPLASATVQLTASSEAGQDDERVSASIDVVSRAPEGQADPAVNHPQEDVAVYCYWEDYPPTDDEKRDPQNSDKFVIEAHYSAEEVAALGMQQNRYTLIRNDRLGYSALYAQGPYLEDVLADVFFRQTNEDLAAISVDAVNSLTFFCYDGLYGRAVSGSYLLETSEYYYPWIYTDDPAADAQLVKPELALLSFKTADDNSAEYADASFYGRMDDANRFRLALGANLDSLVRNQQLAVKWINTIYVELKGGPAVQSGDGETAAGDAQAGLSATPHEAGISEEGSGERFRIYQVMNRFDPFTDEELDHRNPWLALACILGALAFAAGAFSTLRHIRKAHSEGRAAPLLDKDGETHARRNR